MRLLRGLVSGFLPLREKRGSEAGGGGGGSEEVGRKAAASAAAEARAPSFVLPFPGGVTTLLLGGRGGIKDWPHARSASTKSANLSDACRRMNSSRERSREGSLRGALGPRARQLALSYASLAVASSGKAPCKTEEMEKE